MLYIFYVCRKVSTVKSGTTTTTTTRINFFRSSEEVPLPHLKCFGLIKLLTLLEEGGGEWAPMWTPYFWTYKDYATINIESYKRNLFRN